MNHSPSQLEKEIFEQAAPLSPDQRDEVLRTRCAGDEAMRRRLERLLSAHDRAEAFMAAPTVDAPQGTPTQPEPAPGDHIDDYEIRSTLGEGGFGRVYLAQQHRPVARQVALKVLKHGLDSHAVAARFESERQALALMDHPGVARVFDAGVTPDGRPYFAMELVRGEPITAYCKARGLTTRQRVELFEQVCLAVQHAHHKGIIHRDLKPSNVLVVEVDGKPRPKVIDFGIAKALHTEGARDPGITLEGHLVGTPAYMSPEQLAGGAATDTRSDVYTLGVLLYQTLTGLLPFEQPTDGPLPLAAFARTIAEETPPRPSARVARAGGKEAKRLAAQLRADLDWIVMRALEKDPARRYQTAFALATDLRRYLRDEPVDAGPPSGVYRLAKFAQRHRGEFLAATLVLVALVGGLVSSLVFAARVEQQSRLTARELEKSRQLNAFTTGILSGVDPAIARGEDTTLLRRMLEDARGRLEHETPEFPEVEADMRRLLGTALFKIADFPGALEQFQRTLELDRRTLGPEHPTTLETHDALAQAHVEMSRFDDARREFQAVLDAAGRAFGPDDLRTLRTVFNLASVDRLAGRHRQALERFTHVAERRSAILGPDHPDTLSARNSAATCADELGEHDAAAETYREIIEAQRRTLGEDHPHTLATRNNLADALMADGRVEEASEILAEVVDSKRRVLGPEHPGVATSLNNLAHAMRRLDRPAEAEKLLREALDIAGRASPEPDLRTLILTNSLASVLLDTGRPEEAEAMVGEVFGRVEALVGPHHALTISMLSNRARAALETGRPGEAIELADLLHARATEAQRPDAASRAEEIRRAALEARGRSSGP
jgi:eukaryotic-like serine/threonine-protein kinase